MRFRELSFRTKIVSICLGVSTLSLLLASLAFLSIELIKERNSLHDRLINQAEILGQSAASALVFYDPDFAGKTLAGLAADPHIQTAVLYAPDSTVFARYTKSGMAAIEPPIMPTPDLARFTTTFLEVARPCLLKNERVGIIYLRSDLTEFSDRLRISVFIFSGVLLAAIAASFLLSWWAQSLIMLPVMALTTAARLVTEQADYSQRVDQHGSDELGILTNTFNKMLDQVQMTTNLLTESEELFRSYFERGLLGMAIVSPDMQWIKVNDRLQHIFGYWPEEFHRLKWDDLLHPEEITTCHRQYEEILSGKIDGYMAERRMLRKNGQLIYVTMVLSGVRYGSGRLSHIVISLDDITSRKDAEQELIGHRRHLEELVAQRTTDLEAANQELKDFAYIVSHDLKAPLRAISQLATWVSEDYGATLPAEGQQQLGLMIERVRRMHALIDGILQYSRIGRVQEQRRDVDLNKVVADAIVMLTPPPHIQVCIDGELPIVFAEQVRMEQLFQNLIGNAIKYMDKPQGEIVISAINEGNRYRITVADNGPGIDKKYHQKIFQIFQTLAPSSSNTDSTGIGLSLVKKIIELHGGTIEVESEPGKGSKFIFTLEQRGAINAQEQDHPAG